MPFYQPCIIVVLWRYKYGKIGDCKDNDDSEEFRPFLGDVSFYFSISFGFVWCKWFSSAKMCLNHTRTLHTDSLPTMIPPSYDHHLRILKKMRDFDKKKKYIQRKIFQDPLQRQSAISCWSISWLMANRAVLHSYQKSAKWYHLPPLTLLSHSDFGIIVYLNLYFIVFHHIDGTTC